ncbi:MAG: hypothetical protein DCF22_09485 [Leptolyngbya sp.]|nr:MAG: hypothetical protein DCF22_09485 [Leptolyngbya sp.]
MKGASRMDWTGKGWRQYQAMLLLLTLSAYPVCPALGRDRLENLKDPNYWIQLCMLLAKSKPVDALPACERAIELRPGDPKLWAQYGALQLGQKQYPEAIASLEQAIKRQPKNSQVLSDQCLAWAELGETETAIATCEKALKLNVNWGERSPVVAQHRRSSIIDQPEVYQESIKFYDEALKKLPKDSLTLVYRCEALAKVGEFRAAIDSCEQALNGNGNWGGETPTLAWSNRGFAYRSLNELEPAVQSLDRALQLNPNQAPTWLQQGTTLRQLKRPNEALIAYTRAIELQPNSSQALLGQCIVLNQLQQLDSAIAACKKAIAADGNWTPADIAQAWNQQSLALTKLGKLEEALAAADRGVGMRPDWAEIWNTRAVVLWYLKRTDEALVSVQQALKLNPDDAQAWANQGRIWRSLDQLDNALIAYGEALKRNSQDATVWANQSAVQWLLGDPNAALASANRAIAVNPKLGLAWQNHAIALVALKQYTEAQKSYEQAITWDKTNADSWAGFGVVLLQLRQYDKAQQALQTAISLNPNQAIAQQALKSLTEWQKQQSQKFPKK